MNVIWFFHESGQTTGAILKRTVEWWYAFSVVKYQLQIISAVLG